VEILVTMMPFDHPAVGFSFDATYISNLAEKVINRNRSVRPREVFDPFIE
jgi:hypothetical protein